MAQGSVKGHGGGGHGLHLHCRSKGRRQRSSSCCAAAAAAANGGRGEGLLGHKGLVLQLRGRKGRLLRQGRKVLRLKEWLLQRRGLLGLLRKGRELRELRLRLRLLLLRVKVAAILPRAIGAIPAQAAAGRLRLRLGRAPPLVQKGAGGQRARVVLARVLLVPALHSALVDGGAAALLLLLQGRLAAAGARVPKGAGGVIALAVVPLIKARLGAAGYLGLAGFSILV